MSGATRFLTEARMSSTSSGDPGEAGLEHGERFHPLALLRVGHADDCGFVYRRMFVESILDFSGRDAVAAALDDVVDARHVPEEPIFILVGKVTGEAPALDDGLLLPFGLRQYMVP